MSGGLYPLSVVAAFLGKRDGDVKQMVKLDKLPALRIPTEKKEVYRFALGPLHRWLERRCANEAITIDELREGLEEARKEMGRRASCSTRA